MNICSVTPRAILDRLGVFVCLTGCLAGLQALGGTGSLWQALPANTAFVAGLLVIAALYDLPHASNLPAWHALGLAVTAAVTGGLYALGLDTPAAWVYLAGVYAWLAGLDRMGSSSLFSRRWGGWLARLGLAAVGGLAPAILSQVESRFADEELYVLIQAVELAGFCLLFLAAQSYLRRRRPQPDLSLRRQSRLGLGGLACAMVALGVWGVAVYRDSFYPPSAPGYPGVTEQSPFLCGQVTPDSQAFSGQAVYEQLLALVETHPRKGVPELGLLALGTQDPGWAEAFRELILAEAQAGWLTGPANSVKYTQYQAALHAYYAPRVRAAFPQLFSDQEWETLRAWFAAINQRALTVEWVDWMYALALAKWPEGLYENQENGAGLLAILEAEGLGAPELSAANRAYLERSQRGWLQRFHNTDDAYIYQPEWITNAYFQQLWAPGQPDAQRAAAQRSRAFEWLLLQALPDGAPVCYNHPDCQLPVGTAYLAASLLGDGRYVWWSGRMLAWAARSGVTPQAQAGAEALASLQGVSPTAGSCLIYSDSGLPNQAGPLAPDKIVLRDGWDVDASYALLNLRFSGWHRYKATNSMVLLYQDGPIVVEKNTGELWGWLPAGRSLFRDKRMPRENLNGLLVSRTGWSRVTHVLTGLGSAWAQDPPAYAQVEAVDWLGPVDASWTVIDGWRGWTHSRAVYLVHDGPVIVLDSAQGQGQAALAWHMVGEGRREGDSLWLRGGPAPMRVTWPAQAWPDISVQPSGTAIEESGLGSPNLDVTYRAAGQLELATIFLPGEWGAVQHTPQQLDGGQLISLGGLDKRLVLLHNISGQWLQTGSLATDGRWAMLLQQGSQQQLCFGGGRRVQASLDRQPAELRDAQGQSWPAWEWAAGQLTLHNAGASLCLELVRETEGR